MNLGHSLVLLTKENDKVYFVFFIFPCINCSQKLYSLANKNILNEYSVLNATQALCEELKSR